MSEQGEKVWRQYNCPYCGKEITPDNVLFKERCDHKFEDIRRYNFLRGCYADWPFEDGSRFGDMYYKPTVENIAMEQNGFPQFLNVASRSAKTPGELDDRPNQEEVRQIKELRDDDHHSVSTRVCPNCHLSLPENFNMYATVNVTLLGGRASGKTAYILNLLQQLNKQLLGHNMGTVKLEKESQTYYDALNEGVKEAAGVTVATPTAERLFPFVLRHTHGEKTTFINIYDIAGEGFDRADYMLNHVGVKKAEVVLLLIDPNELNGGGFYSAQKEREIRENGISEAVSAEGGPVLLDEQHDHFDLDIVSYLVEAVREHKNYGLFGNVKQVIGIMTKIDQPLLSRPDLFAGNCILKSDIGGEHQTGVDKGVVAEVELNVERFYKYNTRSEKTLKKLIGENFRNKDGKEPIVNLMAVSTYTAEPGGNRGDIVFKNRYTEAAPKHRIIEPFMVMLATYNLVPFRDKVPAPTPSPAPVKRGLFGRKKR